MKEIKFIHDFIRFIYKKFRSGFISPEEIDDALNWASVDLHNRYYGDWKENIPGRPVATTAFEVNQRNTDDLSPFVSDPTTLSFSAGVASLPADYVHWAMCQTTNDGIVSEVKIIDHAKWTHRITRITAAPSTESPVARIYNGKIEIMPTDLDAVKLTYLKLPTKTKWAYTVVNNRPVYDDGNSVDFEWGRNNHIEIMKRAFEYLGLNTEDVGLIQYAQYRKERAD